MSSENENSFTFILIPWEESKPIQTIDLEYPDMSCDVGGGDLLPVYLKSLLDENIYQIEATPLKRMSPPPKQHHDESLFLQASGVYAYHCLNSDTNYKFANIRATSLSMACGLLSQRFYGDVFLSRLGYFINPRVSSEYAVMMNKSILLDEIKYATYVSPDLRKQVIFSLLQERNNKKDETNVKEEIEFPGWILEASKSNYEDAAVLALLASTMNRQQNDEKQNDRDDANEEIEDEGKSRNEENVKASDVKDHQNQIGNKAQIQEQHKEVNATHVPVRTTLCLQCRRPSQHLCPNCEATYFCESPRPCKDMGWSHVCLCETWGLYARRRVELSTFPFTWASELVSRQCQLSHHPYESFLEQKLDICDITKSWWKTEKSGWKGGTSDSAKQIKLLQRLTYIDGFGLDESLLPPERNIIANEGDGFNRDPETNLIELNCWSDYYRLRGITLESPVALLCTFPLTLYYALQEFGKVPITVSRMLQRTMRIHIVGVEKELNFLDLFKEFGFLLPVDVNVSASYSIKKFVLTSIIGNIFRLIFCF